MIAKAGRGLHPLPMRSDPAIYPSVADNGNDCQERSSFCEPSIRCCELLLIDGH